MDLLDHAELVLGSARALEEEFPPAPKEVDLRMRGHRGATPSNVREDALMAALNNLPSSDEPSASSEP
jgi:hypothetical protein